LPASCFQVHTNLLPNLYPSAFPVKFNCCIFFPTHRKEPQLVL
jgi:hypothetical protein